MSYRKRTAILSIVLGALVAAYTLGLLVNRPPVPPVVVPTFNVAAANRIQAGSITLKRKRSDGWEVAIDGSWYPADAARVERMLAFLSGLKASRIASRSQSDWASFHVNAATALRLNVSGRNGRIVELFVGETGGDGGTYVRSSTSPDVFEVFGNLPDYVGSDTAYWSYLKILPESLTVDSLQTISISAHGFSVGGESVDQSYLLVSSVVRGQNAWTVRGNGAIVLDRQKVLSLEAELIQMVGDGFAAKTAATGFDKPLAVITITDQQGGKWSIIVGNRHGAQFYVKRADLPYVYLVNEWTLHRAILRLSDLSVGEIAAKRNP